MDAPGTDAPGDGEHSVGCLVAVLLLGTVLAVPIGVVLAFFVTEWLLVLGLLPIAALVRVALMWPWAVVVWGHSESGHRRRYAAIVRGWRASRSLIATIRQEIATYGEPRSIPPARH